MSEEMDRIHRVLDGELPRAALSPAEEARLREMERALGRASATLREARAPDLTVRVLEALPEAPDGIETGLAAVAPAARPHDQAAGPASDGAAAVSPLRGVWRWLWNPVPVSVRPGYAALAAVLVLLAAALLPRLIPAGTPAVMVENPSDESPRLYVQFRIEVPGAADVALAGSFSGWRAEHHLTEVAPGVWSIMLPLSPGVHDYAFVIDGERMIVDPYAPVVADPFGGSNSRLFLSVPNGSA